ncbi:MAG: GDSL-type esterase/lipase family protein [Spirochaetota bacterium]
MTTIRAHATLFEGAVSFDESPAGIAPVRLPVERASLYPSPDDRLMGRARSASGARLRFATDSRRIELAVEPAATDDEPRIVDLTIDGEPIASQPIASGSPSVSFEPPDGGGQPGSDLPVYELWLHQFHPVRVASIAIDDGATFAVPADRRPRWVTYGSSITMCRTATSPARTWPAVAARAHGLNLTSLGFGGECHLDPMVARVARDLPADIITLKLGINVYGGASLNARSYPGAVIGLVSIIRERHPTTPIGVITSIVSPERETTANAVGCTLEDYREMTRDATRRLQRSGDERLTLFEGTDLFGESDAHLLPDGLHPNGEGYELIGRRVAERVLPELLALRG